MTKATYSVPIVKRELLSLWHEHWNKRTRKGRKADKHGELSQTALIEAKNANEAAKLAEAKNPGCVAITSAIQKLR